MNEGMNDPDERVVHTTCASHCGGTCVLRVHIKDGVITRIESDGSDEPQMRACARGRAYIKGYMIQIDFCFQ